MKKTAGFLRLSACGIGGEGRLQFLCEYVTIGAGRCQRIFIEIFSYKPIDKVGNIVYTAVNPKRGPRKNLCFLWGEEEQGSG